MSKKADSEQSSCLQEHIQQAIARYHRKLSEGEVVRINEPEGTLPQHWEACAEVFARQGYAIERHNPWLAGMKVKIIKV